LAQEKPEISEHRRLWIVLPPYLERKRTEKGSCLDTWIDRNLVRMLLGTSALKEGVVIAVEEGTPQEKKSEPQEGR
jgi:hypothetical protein